VQRDGPPRRLGIRGGAVGNPALDAGGASWTTVSVESFGAHGMFRVITAAPTSPACRAAPAPRSSAPRKLLDEGPVLARCLLPGLKPQVVGRGGVATETERDEMVQFVVGREAGLSVDEP